MGSNEKQPPKLNKSSFLEESAVYFNSFSPEQACFAAILSDP